MNLPLCGVRILAIEQYGAGPYGSAHLADLGAEVIKIENRRTGGDMARMVDFMTGTTAAMALVAGIFQARRTGMGRDIDVSLLDVAMHQLSYPAIWYLNEGTEIGRAPRSAHLHVAPSQLFRTKDGWTFVMCQISRFWERLCTAIGRPDLVEAPEFEGYEARNDNRDRLTEILDNAFTERTTQAWIDLLGGQVLVAPVRHMGEALEAPEFRDRGGIVEVAHCDRDRLRLLNSPVRAGTPVPARPGPQLGEDTDAILSELGYSPGEIADLRDTAAI